MSYIWRKFSWMSRVVIALLVFPGFFFACSPNNVTVDDSLQSYFDSAGVKGTFGMFDNGQGHFTICNLSRFSDSFYTPAATFDILMSLVAIQSGVMKDDSAKLLADTIMRVESRQPENFGELFRDTSVISDLAFYDLATRIGKDTLKKWIDSLQYGNKVMGADAADPFWEDNQLKINCDEQLGLLKKLYFNQLHFFDAHAGDRAPHDVIGEQFCLPAFL